MAETHVDQPNAIRWFPRQSPRPVVGPCPHATCKHHLQRVIAWGPDYTRYELVRCDVDEHCAGTCRSWTDGSARSTSPWLQVAALAGSADDTREGTT